MTLNLWLLKPLMRIPVFAQTRLESDTGKVHVASTDASLPQTSLTHLQVWNLGAKPRARLTCAAWGAAERHRAGPGLQDTRSRRRCSLLMCN